MRKNVHPPAPPEETRPNSRREAVQVRRLRKILPVFQQTEEPPAESQRGESFQVRNMREVVLVCRFVATAQATHTRRQHPYLNETGENPHKCETCKNIL